MLRIKYNLYFNKGERKWRLLKLKWISKYGVDIMCGKYGVSLECGKIWSWCWNWY